MTTKDEALQMALDIPMSEVQFSAPEKQPPATSAELCERLRRLSEEMDTLSEAMRQLAGNNKRLHDNGSRRLWSFAAGVLAYVIRVFGGYPDGVAFAVLLLNICVPLIDLYTQPPIFGMKDKP